MGIFEEFAEIELLACLIELQRFQYHVHSNFVAKLEAVFQSFLGVVDFYGQSINQMLFYAEFVYFIFNIFAVLAQFERDLIRKRTLAGLAAAQAKGKQDRRPKVSLNDPKIITAKNYILIRQYL